MAKKTVNTTKLAKNATSGSKKTTTTKRKTTTSGSKTTTNKTTEKPKESKIDMYKKRAYAIIDDLDEGQLTEDKVKNIDEIINDKPENNAWLKEQVKLLTESNEKLKEETSEYKKNYNDIYARYQSVLTDQNSGGGDFNEVNDEIKNGVLSLYDEFVKVYKSGQYDRIFLKNLITKFQNKFEFLR